MICHPNRKTIVTMIKKKLCFFLQICFDDNFSRIWIVARTCGLAGLQLNHYQMLFLMRQLERISEMTAWLAHDAERQPEAEDGYGSYLAGFQYVLISKTSETKRKRHSNFILLGLC